MNKNVLATISLLWYIIYLPIAVTAKITMLNEEQGLSNILVTSIAKDNTGNMWIGTKKGLNKYDGYTFILVEELKNADINCLQYDSYRNFLWIGTEKGLYYLNCFTKDIVYCTPNDSNNAVVNILMIGNSVLFGFRHKYILQISIDLHCNIIYRYNVGTLHKNCMTKDEYGNLYVLFTDDKYIIKINPNTKKHESINISKTKLFSFINYFNNQLYLGSINDGICQTFLDKKIPKYLAELNSLRGSPECVIQNKGRIYIAFRNATNIYEINVASNSIKKISERSEILVNKLIFCMYLDNFNTLWIGTNKGLVKYVPDNPAPRFENILTNEKKTTSTREIIEDKNGDIYVASYAGFYKFDIKSKKWINFDTIFFNNKNKFFCQRSMLNLSSKYLYIGSDANFFVRYNKWNQKFDANIINNQNLDCWKLKMVYSMAMDCYGKTWLGTENGLVTIDTITNVAVCTKDKFKINTSVRYIHMLADRHSFWAGCTDGLYLIDINKGVLLHLNETTNPALTGNMINCVTTDYKGNIWIGTEQNGINVLSVDYKNIYTITRKDGLSSNEVYSMLWQDTNKLWIGTYQGLNYYNSNSHSFLNYYESDGISNNEFNQNSAMKAKDGKLYFGGIDGITSFYPTKLEFNQARFSIFTSALSKWDKSREQIIYLNPSNNDNIIMNPGDNLLSLAFAINDYSNHESAVYSYKIEGLHNDWVSLGVQNILTLESLKPGDYKLFIKAQKGSRGFSSLNTLVYHLSIKREFYQTVWFYILLSFLVASIIYFYFKLQLKNLIQLERLRIKIASNLHDDVGSLLTRITMSADNLIHKMPQENENKERLKNVSELSREANVAMSDVLWAIDARNDYTNSMTDRMREHAEDMLMPKGIEVEIDFLQVDQSQKLSPEYRQHLFLIFKESINNIIKHSNATYVKIKYTQNKESCVLKIKNNGASSSNNQIITGQGLKNIKMRAELLKGKAVFKNDDNYFEVLVII